MDSLATTLLFPVMLLGQVRLFCGVILRKCVNIHTTLSDIVILPPWVTLLTYIILRVRVFSSTVIKTVKTHLKISLKDAILLMNQCTSLLMLKSEHFSKTMAIQQLLMPLPLTSPGLVCTSAWATPWQWPLISVMAPGVSNEHHPDCLFDS